MQRNPAGQARYYFNEDKPHIKYSSAHQVQLCHEHLERNTI
jgi:hypothetical protein